MRQRVFLIREGTSIFFPPNLDPTSDKLVDGIIMRNPSNNSQTAYWALMSETDFNRLFGKGKKIQIKPSNREFVKFEAIKIGDKEASQKEDIFYHVPNSNIARVIGADEHVKSFFVLPNPKLILVPEKLPGVS